MILIDPHTDFTDEKCSLIVHVPLMIAELRKDGVMTLLNFRFLEKSGTLKGELEGRHFLKAVFSHRKIKSF